MGSYCLFCDSDIEIMYGPDLWTNRTHTNPSDQLVAKCNGLHLGYERVEDYVQVKVCRFLRGMKRVVK